MDALVLRYRPRVFEEVFGQDHPVRFLSGLITRGQVCRNILLHGSIGSGKTTLARIYAKALNCKSPTKNGSPCLVCKSCQAFDNKQAALPFREFDAPKFEKIDHFKEDIDAFLAPQTNGDRRVIFVDEAHGLPHAKGAFDFLLKTIEEPKPETAFCFATTEFDKIPKALRSRLFCLELRPLHIDRAVEFLGAIAEQEGIRFDPEALALLVGLGDGQPRNMLQSLDQIRDFGPVTCDRVREVFGLDHTDIITQYFRALATGDFGNQTKIFFAWNEAVRTKIKLVHLFLLSMYYRDLRKIDLRLDATIASISVVERQPIIQAFQARLGVDESGLISFWQKMMAFWPVITDDQSDESLLMRLTMFQRFASSPPSAVSLPPIEIRGSPAPEKRSRRPRRHAVQNPRLRTSGKHRIAPDAKADFLSFDQVRDLFNAASSFTQEYGLLFNARITVRHDLFGCRNEQEAADLFSGFNREFAYGVKRWFTIDLHRLAVQEHNEELGYCGRIIAHIPDIPDKSTKKARDWLRRWRMEKRTAESAAEAIEFGPLEQTSRDARVRFHWASVRWLCAGMDPTDDRRQDLKFKKSERRKAGAIGSQRRFSTSASLNSNELEAATENGMEFLSAFDDQAWDQLYTGWELKEHLDRKEAQRERSEADTTIRNRYPEGSGAQNAAEREKRLTELRANWPDRYNRPRSWNVWPRG